MDRRSREMIQPARNNESDPFADAIKKPTEKTDSSGN